MHKRAAATVLIIAAGAMLAAAGCSRTEPAEASDAHFARVYAEVMLLHERDVMNGHIPDSLYQTHVDSLLKAQGTTVDEFKARSAELMKNDEAWRAFLADVSLTFDSVKTAHLQHP